MRPAFRPVVVLLAAVALAGVACGGSSDSLEISIDPESGTPGTTISIDSSECEQEASGSLVDPADDEVASVQFSSPQSGSVTVPEDAAPGTYTVRVVCGQNPRVEEPGTLTTDIVLDSATFEVTG